MKFFLYMCVGILFCGYCFGNQKNDEISFSAHRIQGGSKGLLHPALQSLGLACVISILKNLHLKEMEANIQRLPMVLKQLLITYASGPIDANNNTIFHYYALHNNAEGVLVAKRLFSPPTTFSLNRVDMSPYLIALVHNDDLLKKSLWCFPDQEYVKECCNDKKIIDNKNDCINVPLLQAILYDSLEEIEAIKDCKLKDYLIRVMSLYCFACGEKKRGLWALQQQPNESFSFSQIAPGFLADYSEIVDILIEKKISKTRILLYAMKISQIQPLPSVIAKILSYYKTLKNMKIKSEQQAILHIALSCQLPISMLQAILNKGIDINAKDTSEYTPLIIAVFLQDECYVRQVIPFLIDKGANLLQADKNGSLPIHMAKSFSSTHILLRFNKEITDKMINAKNNDGYTPLFFHCMFNKWKVVRLLLEYGADPNISKASCCPIHIVCKGKMNSNNYKILKELVSYKANIDVKDIEGKTPLYHLVQALPAIPKKHIQRQVKPIKELLQAGANLHEKDTNQKSPIDYLMEFQDETGIIQALLTEQK